MYKCLFLCPSQERNYLKGFCFHFVGTFKFKFIIHMHTHTHTYTAHFTY